METPSGKKFTAHSIFGTLSPFYIIYASITWDKAPRYFKTIAGTTSLQKAQKILC